MTAMDTPLAPSGALSLRRVPAEVPIDVFDLAALDRLSNPLYASGRARDWREENHPAYLAGLEEVQNALDTPGLHLISSLHLSHIDEEGVITDLGLAGHRKVTDVGVAKLVALMNQSDATTATNFKYHGIGTNNTAEAAADTALNTEIPNSHYQVSGQRASGNQTVGASVNVYRTTAVVSVGAIGGTDTIVEHGVFSAQAVGAGTLWDRTVFAGIPLTANQAVQAQYDLTIASGG